jgi:hypothetical protein
MNVSGSDPVGKDVTNTSTWALISKPIARNAALIPDKSPSNRILTLFQNREINTACFSVNEVPKGAQTLLIPF